MIDLTISISNADVPTVREWIAGQQAELSDKMLASTPTARAGKATLVYAMLSRWDTQLRAHVIALREADAATRKPRRK